MAEKLQKTRKSQKKVAEQVETPSPQDVKTKADLKASLDDLLDEIDEVLEENAETFVKEYVQKGGE